MKYKIKDFRDEGDNKYVGFMVERDDGERFAIDKKVPLSEGKADDEYIHNPDDECRVFYTGVTRAKEHLHIITPQTDRYFNL